MTSRQEVLVESGFGYGVVGADLHVFQDGGPLYVLAEYHSAPVPDDAWLMAQPSRMLNARFQVVEFVGRERELADLAAWRDAGNARLAARWLRAPGGQGKTRLAARFAELSAAAGWKVVTASYGPGSVILAPGSQELRLAGTAGLLMIIDYADRWPLSHLAWLFSNALLQKQVPTRMLLLARSASAWPAIRAALSEKQADTSELLLPPLAGTDLEQRREMFAAARNCFARRYYVPDPADIDPPVPLDRPEYGLTLAIHMAALTAVDACTRGTRTPSDMAGLSAYLLDREQLHWTRLYESGLAKVEFETPPSVMARAVFTASLTGPVPYLAGASTLARLDLGLAPHRVIDDHATCYPSADGQSVLEPVYPDRLAEDFVALSLTGHPVTSHPGATWALPAIHVLVSREDDGAAPAYMPRMVTLLAAAAGPGRWPHVAHHLAAILNADPALAVAAGSGALAALADVPDFDVNVLEAIEALFPDDRSVDLDEGIAALTGRLARARLATTSDPAVRAELLGTLGRREANAGLDAQALPRFEEAAAIWRVLATADPALHLPSLTRALDDLARGLAHAGRGSEAVAAGGEAVSSYRRLAATDPDAYRSALAISLANLGSGLAGVGQLEEALGAGEEAVAIRRALSEQIRSAQTEPNPAAYQPGLAGPLLLLGRRLADLGRYEQALTATNEAVPIFLALAHVAPDAYLPELAQALDALGEQLSQVGDTSAAVDSAESAVGIHRQLVEANPAAYLVGLAGSLVNLGGHLSRAERHADAIQIAEEAAGLYRQLAEDRPAPYLNSLASAQINLGALRLIVGRREGALEATQEAVAIYRQLVHASPGANLPGLAAALGNYSTVLSRLGRPDALSRASESVRIYRELADTRPGAHLAGLAASLLRLGSLTAELGPPLDAVTPMNESVRIYRQLASVRPDAHRYGLADALTELCIVLRAVGRLQESLAAGEEATAIARSLADADTGRHLVLLARSLMNTGATLADLGLLDQAVALATEVTSIDRRRAQAGPAENLPGLAASLRVLGAIRSRMGRADDAVAAGEEAVEIGRRLAEARPSAHLPTLGESLGMLAHWLEEAGRRRDALHAFEEAASIWQQLAMRDADRYTPNLAEALRNLSDILTIAGQPDQALAPGQNAVTIYQDLAASDPVTYLPALAKTLKNVSGLLGKLGQLDRARSTADEAVSHYRQLTDLDPGSNLDGLIGAQSNLSGALLGLGYTKEGLLVGAEAVQISRQLARADPARHLRDLAAALQNFAAMRSWSHLDLRNALTASEEALRIYTRLARAKTDAFIIERDQARATRDAILNQLKS